MGDNDSVNDKAEETDAKFQGTGRPSSFENIKNIIAGKLHHIADTIDEKASDPDAQSSISQENQVSGWLNHSAEYVRQFDCEQANANVREYVGQNPGRCLLIAGGVGLIIGTILRRR